MLYMACFKGQGRTLGATHPAAGVSRCDRVVQYYAADSGSGANVSHLHRKTFSQHARKLFAILSEISLSKISEMRSLRWRTSFWQIRSLSWWFWIRSFNLWHAPLKYAIWSFNQNRFMKHKNNANRDWFHSDSDYNFNKEPVIRICSHNVHCRRCERRNTCKQNKQQVRIFAGRRTQERTQGLLGRVW